MDQIDWTAPAGLFRRSDSGSDMDFDFVSVGKGPLADLVHDVMAMTPDERARLVLDAPGLGSLEVARILQLGERPDLPPRGG